MIHLLYLFTFYITLNADWSIYHRVFYMCFIIEFLHIAVTDTLYTLHCTLYIIHCTLYTAHYTLHIVHCTLYTAHCTLHIHVKANGK